MPATNSVSSGASSERSAIAEHQRDDQDRAISTYGSALSISLSASTRAATAPVTPTRPASGSSASDAAYWWATRYCSESLVPGSK